MDVERTISLPLARNPEILWGLSLTDLPWILSGFPADLAVWHLNWPWTDKGVALVLISLAAATAAWARIEGESLSHWAGLMARFWLAPKRYLPVASQSSPFNQSRKKD